MTRTVRTFCPESGRLCRERPRCLPLRVEVHAHRPEPSQPARNSTRPVATMLPWTCPRIRMSLAERSAATFALGANGQPAVRKADRSFHMSIHNQVFTALQFAANDDRLADPGEAIFRCHAAISSEALIRAIFRAEDAERVPVPATLALCRRIAKAALFSLWGS